MSRTQPVLIIDGSSPSAFSANVSKEVPEAANFDEAVFHMNVKQLNGAPTSATLDLDVEMLCNTSNAPERWIRLNTKFLGRITDADASATYTLGDQTLGTFQQVTQATTLEYVEIRGLDSLIGHRLRITLRPTFTGGSSPSWQAGFMVWLKSSSP